LGGLLRILLAWVVPMGRLEGCVGSILNTTLTCTLTMHFELIRAGMSA
jgi:hypothetical protein